MYNYVKMNTQSASETEFLVIELKKMRMKRLSMKVSDQFFQSKIKLCFCCFSLDVPKTKNMHKYRSSRFNTGYVQ